MKLGELRQGDIVEFDFDGERIQGSFLSELRNDDKRVSVWVNGKVWVVFLEGMTVIESYNAQIDKYCKENNLKRYP